MKAVIIFRYTVLLIPFFLIGQGIDTTIVKYFPTDLTRSILLQDGIDKKKVKKGAYFKATYDGSGDLIKIEYIPSKRDKGVLDTVQTRTLFYSDWNDYKRELSNPISEWDSERLPHYKATFGRNGRLTFVERYNGLGEKLFTYKLRWNKEGTRSAYKVIFHKNMIITQLDSVLFANPASEIRTNWVADFRSIKDGRPKSVSVYDELGSKYYSYKFYYDDLQDSINQTEKITSRYFQRDTSYLGSHEIYIAKEKFLTQLDYFNIDGSLISRNAYWMDPILEEVIVTTANEEGEIIGRHIVSKANTLWRQYRLGGTYKDKEEEKVSIRERKVVKDRIIEEASVSGQELKYCKSCKKPETRNDCAYGPEEWDRSAVNIEWGEETVYEATGRWVDSKGRSHKFSISTNTVVDHGYIKDLVKSRYPAKRIFIKTDKEKSKKKKKDAKKVKKESFSNWREENLTEHGNKNKPGYVNIGMGIWVKKEDAEKKKAQLAKSVRGENIPGFKGGRLD